MKMGSTPAETNDVLEADSWTDSRSYSGVSLFQFEGLSRPQVDFITTLWGQIDQAIEENPFLSEYNHTGHVFLRFEIDESGHLAPRSLVAKAADRVLKVIAARAVRKAIRNERGELHFPGRRLVRDI
jgi:hypothetical protein